MKKYIKILSLFFLSFTFLICLFGCEKSNQYVEISTAEEFLAMKESKSYRLMSDINLKYKNVSPIKVKNFDGNGHTIKNAYIVNFKLIEKKKFATSESDKNNIISLFYGVKSLSNLVIENVSVTAALIKPEVKASYGRSYGNASILGYDIDYIDNVTIRKCEIDVTYDLTVPSGTFITYDDYYKDNQISTAFIDSGRNSNSVGSVSIKNCKVRDCKMSVHIDTNTTNIERLIVSGIGVTHNAENNIMENCEISADGYCYYGITYGAFNHLDKYGDYDGEYHGILKNNKILNNMINLSAQDKIYINAGGLVGRGGFESISENIVDSNLITINSKDDSSKIAGLVVKSTGEIRNNLVKGNEFISSNRGNVAGFISDAKGIRNCISVNNKLTSNDNTEGFSSTLSGTIVNCYAYNQDISGNKVDQFSIYSNGKKDLILNCYVGTTSNNSLGLEKIDEEDVLNVMDFDKSIWSYKDNTFQLNR